VPFTRTASRCLIDVHSPFSLRSSILPHLAGKLHTHTSFTSSKFSKRGHGKGYNELHISLRKLSITYLLNELQQLLPQQQCLPMFRTRTTSPTSPVTTIPFSGTTFCTQNTWSRPMRRLCPLPHWSEQGAKGLSELFFLLADRGALLEDNSIPHPPAQ
jgi:hypothetical protein